MNAKHYVSQDVAKMLQEKGFNESCIVLWDDVFKELIPASSICSYKNQTHPSGYYSAPSILEAMDWLEQRGIILFFGFNTMCQAWWFSGYHKSKKVYLNDLKGVYNLYKDRNECMNAAIKKGVELL